MRALHAKTKMSISTFFKHLTHTLIARPIIQTSFPRFFIKPYKTIHFSAKNVSSSLSSLTSSSQTPQTHSYVSSSYLSVNILCHKLVSDLLSEALLCFGASSTTIDAKDDDDDSSSDEICISTIFPEGHDVTLSISQASNSIGLKELPSYEITVGEQCDWISKTQESFKPVEVTEGLWIVPEWRDPPNVQATNIILNPGLAFGTGEHPTTKLCLLLLHRSIKGGELVLDYGTGSGVLAITALKLGCSLCVGIDIDPQAIQSARQNAELNNIGAEKLELIVVQERPISTAEREEKYDVVVANILLNPLMDLAETIVSHAKPGGVIGLSGILTEQVPYIMERYSSFLECVSVAEMDNWACICGTKKRNF